MYFPYALLNTKVKSGAANAFAHVPSVIRTAAMRVERDIFVPELRNRRKPVDGVSIAVSKLLRGAELETDDRLSHQLLDCGRRSHDDNTQLTPSDAVPPHAHSHLSADGQMNFRITVSPFDPRVVAQFRSSLGPTVGERAFGSTTRNGPRSSRESFRLQPLQIT